MAVFERLFRLLSDTRKQRKNCERTVKMTQAMMGKMDTNRHLKKESQMSGSMCGICGISTAKRICPHVRGRHVYQQLGNPRIKNLSIIGREGKAPFRMPVFIEVN